MERRSLMLASLAALAAPVTRAALAAEEFPARAIRVILPFAAGGGPDIQMRQLAPKFSEGLGQPVLVDNRVGAAGIVGAQALASAPPDGYTLMYGASTLFVLKAMHPEYKIDATEFAPVTLTASTPTILVVHASSPIKTFDDLVRAAREKAGKMNYGSGGIGTSAHLAAATIVALAKIEAVHIPLRGSVEIPGSLQRGDTDFACPIAGTAVPLVKAGTLRALAVTSKGRMKELPQVPTLEELLKSDVAVQETWFGLFAPKGTPPNVIARLHAAAVRALGDAGVAGAFASGGSDTVASESPDAFGAYIRKEAAKWAQVVRITGVTGG